MRDIERQMLSAFATVARQWGAVPIDGHIAERIGLDIEDSEIRIIYMLGARTRELRPGDVAEELGVTRPTLSKSLTRLRNASLIESAVAQEDKRSIYLRLTAAGKDAYQRLIDMGTGLVRAANDDLTKDEMRTIRDFLDRFTEQLGGPAPLDLPPEAR
ncbi:DNA-binding MarR family transcriptional regulator [Leucobacter komagatae]|uniref:DNA-binding MarR family transcriptional regulator n=1 Tax=Leucobacter komagatae TaxID=55969 RepID=A0A542Y321_9MICO|nr:MarR family transcriptional regulator [Leucobacter komagatae]TQL42484.1 DNA-binding MarR family transcriptional regulator [Leucobacter komagatae]